MENNKAKDQAWELEKLEQLAGIDEEELLNLAQDMAIRLAGNIADMRLSLRMEETTDATDLLHRVGTLAVMLDVLQLRYGDTTEYELDFLNRIDTAFE